MKLVFDAKQFSFELLRNVGYAPYGGSDIGESLATAYRVKDGDMDSWGTEWLKTADRIRGIAEDCARRGHAVSAREAYLRASTYYRMAEFFRDRIHGQDYLPVWRSAVETFREAAARMDHVAEVVEVPYAGTTLPGYFYKPDASDAPRPTLIFNGGQDNLVEELYLVGGLAGVRRGYNVLTFDGPGQGRARREQGLTFRPDFEHVLTPVVDWLLRRPEVDEARLALMGFSMGGYLAARAAAFEHRVKALVLFNGVFDLAASTLAIMPEAAQDAFRAGDDARYDQLVEAQMQHDTVVAWSMRQGMWSIGASGPADYVHRRAAWTLKDVAQYVAAPTLVLKGADDHLLGGGQSDAVYAALTCPKTLVEFTAAEGAEEHCQVGANLLCHQRVFDWLDETLPALAAGGADAGRATAGRAGAAAARAADVALAGA